MNKIIPKAILLTLLSCATFQVSAQMANVSYQARSASIRSWADNSGFTCWESSPTQEWTGYVGSYDNINGTATSTGCQTCDVSLTCDYAINLNLQSRTNAADVLFGTLDAWEDDCGTRCNHESSCGFFDQDDCRSVLTNSYNFRAQGLPTAPAIFTNGPTWGSNVQHQYTLACSWRYTGTTNLITPTCVTQTSNYSAGSVRSWSVNLTAGVSYNFNTCASSTSHDSRIRIYSSDGFTEVANADDQCGVLSDLDFIPATTGTYYVEVSQFTRVNGLAAAGTLSYRINPPTTSTNGGNLIACQNAASVSLNGSTPTIGTGTWTASSGTISFSNVNSATATATGTTPGTYTLTWTINNGGCISASSLQLTVNSLSTAPSSILGTSTICAGGNTVLTVSGGSAGTGATAQWFSGSCGGTAVGTGNSITVSPASTTTYFVRYAGTCNTTTCASQVVTVNTLSTAPTSATASPTAVCAGSASTLNVVGGTLGTSATYRWYSGSCGGAAVGTGTSLSVSPATTTNYFVRLEGVCNTTTCASAILTVNPIPAAPAATNANVCVGDPQILTASGTGTIRWYNVSSGGSVIATGNTFDAGNPSPLPIGSYTYYVTEFNGTCESSPRVAVLLTVSAAPAAPTAASVSVCPNASATLSATGSGTGFNWYNSAIAASPLATGPIFVTPNLVANTSYWVAATNALGCAGARTQVDVVILNVPTPTAAPASICPNTSASLTATAASATGYRWYANSDRTGFLFAGANFNTPLLTATTTYYVSALYSNGCESLLTPVTVTANAAPTPPLANGLSSCDNVNTILTAVGSGGTLSWFNVPTAGIALGTGASYNAGILAANSYTFYVEENNGVCSSNRTAVLVDVYNSPAAPTTTNTTICANNSAILTATGAGVRWYADAALTNQIGSGNSFTTPILTTTTSYFAAVVNGNGCISPAATAVATVNPTPAAPVATGVAICAGNTATVTAAGGTLNWFSDATASSQIGTGASFTSPILSNNATYFVRETSAAGCNSATAAATVTVNALPSAPTANATAVCEGNALIFNGFGAGGTLSWFANATGGAALTTGTSYSITPTAGNYTFYVSENNGTCSSNRIAVTGTVFASPAAPTTTNTTICANNSAVLTATGAGVRWYADAALTNQIGSGNSFTTPILTTTTSYFAAVVNGNGCISPAATATATVNPTPATPVATGAAICAGNTATVTAAGAGGTLNWFSDATATSQIGTGSSFTSPILTNNATYFVRETSAAGCNSATAAATITVNALPSAPTANATSVCEGNALIFNGFGAGGTLSWFANATGGAALTTGATYSVTPTAGNYTFYVSENNGVCNSNRTAVMGTVFANPAAITTTNTTVCANNSAVLTATGAGVRWYADAALTNQIGSGNSFTTPILTTTTSYFAAVVNGNGCISPAATATATVNPTPATPTATGAAICAGNAATVTAAGAGGTLNWFSDATASSQIGTGASFTSPILTNNATYFVRETSAAGCNSATAAATITVNALPSAPTANATAVCEGNALIFNGFGAGGTLSWFANATGGAALATGTSYSITPTAGNYTFYVSENNGTCSSNRIAVTGTVFANPAAITTTNTTVCANNSAILTATGAGVRWYADAALTNQIGSGNSFTTPILTATTSYFAAVVNGNGCISPAATATATVNPTPATPTATGAAICAGNAATVTAAGAGGTLNWFSDATASSQIGTGASFTSPILTNNATYFVRETSAAGCNSATAAATITVNALPSAPTANATAVCEGNALIFNGFGAGGTLSWFANATGGAALATGTSYSITPTAGNYTFYVSENNGTCSSNRIAVTGTVFANPAAITTTNTTVCANNSAILTATGAGVRWYADAALTNQIGSGNSFTTPILTTTTSYFAAVVNGNGCISPAATAVATVNPTPATPTATGAAICAGNAATVTAAGAGGTLNWFSDATASSQIGTGASFTSPILTNNATYFVRETSAAGCNSATAAATITVNALPSAPTANATVVCEGNALIFNGFGAGGTLSWFVNATTSAVAATGTTYNAGNLTAGNYTFFVSETVNGCISNRVPVFGTVNETPATPTIITNSPICEGEDLILQTPTTINGAVYTWTNVLPFSQTGQTIIIPNATAAQGGNYNLRTSLNGCNSPVVSVVVTVNAAPSLSGVIANNSPLCETENLTLTAPNVANATYAWSGPNGFTSTGASITINNVRENDQQGLFTVIATNNTTGCESNPLSTLVQINALPNAAFASNNSPLCAGSTLELMTQQVFGANYSWSGPNGFSSTDRNPLVLNIDSTYAGTYNVVVAIGNCAVTLSTNAVVNIAPITTIIADTSVRQGDVLQLFATGGTLFQWSPATYLSDANSPTPLFSGAPEGMYDYSVFISNSLGCVLEKKVNIQVLPSLQPKFVDLFTPNNDGVNDTWEIGFLQNFAPYTLVIYSRGGLEVLRTENYANDWDGTQNGNELPDGTYWYVLRTQDRTFSGAVTLKR